MKKLIIVLIVVLIVSVVAYFMRGSIMPLYFSIQEPVGVSEGVDMKKADIEEPEVVLDNLDIPWEIVFLPGGEMLITGA